MLAIKQDARRRFANKLRVMPMADTYLQNADRLALVALRIHIKALAKRKPTIVPSVKNVAQK